MEWRRVFSNDFRYWIFIIQITYWGHSNVDIMRLSKKQLRFDSSFVAVFVTVSFGELDYSNTKLFSQQQPTVFLVVWAWFLMFVIRECGLYHLELREIKNDRDIHIDTKWKQQTIWKSKIKKEERAKSNRKCILWKVSHRIFSI